MTESANRTNVNKTDIKPQKLTVEYVLRNVIPVPFECDVNCPICAFIDQDFCVPCEYPVGSAEHFRWENTSQFNDEFFEILKKTDERTVISVMRQVLEKFPVYIKIGKLVSTNLTPHRCNDLYPECYSCHLGEHPDLCNKIGCSCRNPNGDNFINVVWHKNENFAQLACRAHWVNMVPKMLRTRFSFYYRALSEKKNCAL